MNFIIKYTNVLDLKHTTQSEELKEAIITLARQAISSGGTIIIYQEYENAPCEILRVCRYPDELEGFIEWVSNIGTHTN
jgi:hypothetical protein